MRHVLAVTAALLWSAVAAFAADPIGTYSAGDAKVAWDRAVAFLKATVR